MRWNSQYWDYTDGVCKLHMLPSVPCPACMAELENREDEGMFVETSEIERFHGQGRQPEHFDECRHQVF